MDRSAGPMRPRVSGLTLFKNPCAVRQYLESRLTRMNRVVLRPATRADFAALLAEPLPWRLRAIAGEINGELLAVGGLAFPPDHAVTAFLQAGANARRYPVSLHRAALMILAEARRRRIPRVVAVADSGIEPAARWLARLGFERAHLDGHEVWTWSLLCHSG